MQLSNKDELHYTCVMRGTWLDGLYSESPEDITEDRADTCMSSFRNIHRGKKQHDWLLTGGTLHGVLWKHFVGGRWTHLNLAQEKAWPRRPEIEMTSLIFMEPPGCRLANYDWPKKRVAAGHLWPSMVSSGPGTLNKVRMEQFTRQHEHILYGIK